MTKYAIQIISFAGGQYCPLAGQYVKTFDHDAHDGRGELVACIDPSEAMQFDTFEAAFEFWRKPSTVNPIRIDGKPNRPLTASTVTFAKIEGQQDGVAQS